MAEINYMDSLFDPSGNFRPKKRESFFTDSYFSVPSPTTSSMSAPSSLLGAPTAPPPATAANSVGRAVAAGVSGAAGGGSSGSKAQSVGDYDYAKLFDVDHIGSTVQGIGALVSGVAGIMNASEQQKYQKEILALEKDRVGKANARQETYQKNYENSKGW